MENRQMPKLYGTLRPACRDADMLARLIQAGMTGLRINLSHGSLAGCASWFKLPPGRVPAAPPCPPPTGPPGLATRCPGLFFQQAWAEWKMTSEIIIPSASIMDEVKLR